MIVKVILYFLTSTTRLADLLLVPLYKIKGV